MICIGMQQHCNPRLRNLPHVGQLLPSVIARAPFCPAQQADPRQAATSAAAAAAAIMDVERPKAKWKSPWYHVCGNGTGLDWISCCTAYFVPCVAYGITSAKLLKRPWWKEALKYVALFFIPVFLRMLLQVGIHTTCDPEAKDPLKGNAACSFFIVSYASMLPLGLACAVIWAICVGGARRSQIRRVLRIAETRAGGDCCSCMVESPGKGRWSDCCLHFWCVCCALAQEMRTVLHVEAGFSLPAYHGPPPSGYVNVAMEPPEPEDMDRPLLVVVDGSGNLKNVSSAAKV